MKRTRRQAKEELKAAENLAPSEIYVLPLPNPPEPTKPPPPPRKRRKLKKGSSMKSKSTTKRILKPLAEKERDEYDLDDCLTSDDFELIAGILEEVQCCNRKTQRRKHMNRLKKLYFKNNCLPNDIITLQKHQKMFAASLWCLMGRLFRAESNLYSDTTFKFLSEVIVSFGLDDDIELHQFSEEQLIPLYHHVLHFIILHHHDHFVSVRLRILELIKEILVKLHNHPTFYEALKERLLQEVLKVRCRDKAAAVRVQTVQCFPYFKEDRTVSQCVIFSLSYDPNSEVRKSALTVLSEFSSMKTSFYFAKAFDIAESVRVVAFLSMSKLNVSRVGTNRDRYKLIHWGLTQPSDKVRHIVKTNLLPKWLKQCDGKIVNLFCALDIGYQCDTAELIVDALYPNCSTKEFSQLDYSFISSDSKVIPIPELTVEKALAWVSICSKFRNDPFCAHHLLPEGIILVDYIKDLVRTISEEKKEAEKEGVEEEFTLYLCLALTLKLCSFLNFEECARREIVDLLQTILLNPIIEDTIIINAAIDLAGKLVEPEKFYEYNIEILKDVFECNIAALQNENCEKYLGEADENNVNLEEHIRILGTEVVGLKLTEQRVETEPEIHSLVSTENGSMSSPKTVPVAQLSITSGSSGRIVSMSQRISSTPIKKTTKLSLRTVTLKLEELKSLTAEKILERHHLVTNLDKASSKANFLECHDIQQKIEACSRRENELKHQIVELENLNPMAIIAETEESIFEDVDKSAILIPEGGLGLNLILTPEKVNDPKISLEIDSDKSFSISAQSSLKALIILKRILSWSPRICSFLRRLFEQHIINCLEDDDNRVRAHTIYLYAMYGLIDKGEAKRAMIISLQALKLDEQDAQMAGFKSTVDLLIQYKFEFFAAQSTDQYNEIVMPPPFDNPSLSAREREQQIISSLSLFGQENDSEDVITVRVEGFIKLYLADRLKDIASLSLLLSMWINPLYGASEICFHIGQFISVYSKLSAVNALRVLEAFVLSVKEITIVQSSVLEEKEENVERLALARSDIIKLAEFVAISTDSKALSRFEDSYIVHQRLVMDILQILKDQYLDSIENLNLSRSLKFFKITQLKIAQEASTLVNEILEDKDRAYSVDQSKSVQLRTVLRHFLKQLRKCFDLDSVTLEEKDSEDDRRSEMEEIYEDPLVIQSNSNHF